MRTGPTEGRWRPPLDAELEESTLFPQPPCLLTPLEQEAMELTALLAGKLREVIGDGPNADGDWNEAAAHLHVIQTTVLAQAACRAYPRRYRLLGQRLRD